MNDEPHFRRELGVFDATMLVMGAMIGSGVFIVSAEIARDVQSTGWLLLVWGLTGVMSVFGALCYAELAGMMPHAGGQYIYLKRAYSPLWGFLYGWTLFVVIQTGSIAAVAVAFTKFFGVFVPLLGTDVEINKDTGTSPAYVLYRSSPDLNFKIELPLPGFERPLLVFERNKEKPIVIAAGQLAAAAVVLLLTFWNCRGVRDGKIIQNVFTVAKTAGLLLVISLGLFVAADSDVIRRNAADLWSGVSQGPRFEELGERFPTATSSLLIAMVVGGAMVGSLFSADAWNNVTFTGAEIKNPKRTLPLSLAVGVSAVIALYILANLAYLAVLPIGETPVPAGAVDTRTVLERGIAGAKDDRVATAVVQQAARNWGAYRDWAGKLMAATVMISTFGCLNGMILMGARLYYAMARDGLFFHQAGGLNNNGVPAVALICQGVWSVLLIFSGTYNELLDYVIFAALLFYVLTIVGLFVLRRTEPGAERPYRVIGYPILPAIYIFLCAAVMSDLLIVKPNFTWPGLILVCAGVPVYFLWRSTGRKPALPT